MVRFPNSNIGSLPILSMMTLMFLSPVCYAEGGSLSLQKTAPFEHGLAVPEPVKNTCELETKVVEFVKSFAGEEFDQIELVDTATASTGGKALAIKITDLSVESGGAWSGPKHLTIDGTLWQNGKVIGTFTATRVAGGVAWGAYKGTCSLLGRCASTLGKDVAGWLKNPSMSAKLGETR